MKNLLLVSSSSTFGTGYLDHCEAWIRELFADVRPGPILFVPHALKDREKYAKTARGRFQAMGFDLVSLAEEADPSGAIARARGIFIGGGNTFRLLDSLYALKVLEPVRQRVLDGLPYLGTSAGSNVACPTIMTTNDMPIVQPPSFAALDLVPFQINAHYLDPDPDSTHMGETRDLRIREYHEENERPVVALREGSMLRVTGLEIRLQGESSGKIFRRGQDPLEVTPGARVDEILD